MVNSSSRNGLMVISLLASLATAAIIPANNVIPTNVAPVVTDVVAPLFSSLGCYSEPSGGLGRALKAKSWYSDDMTTAACSNFCSSFKYFGTEWGRECFCGDAITKGALPALGKCTKPCAGNAKEFCGEGDHLNIYRNTAVVDPVVAKVKDFEYVGCAIDSPGARVLTEKGTVQMAMTPQICADNCVDYDFFGLEFGRECFCGRTFAGKSAPEGECGMTCSGDATAICGDGDRINVYKSSKAAQNKEQVVDFKFLQCGIDSPANRVLKGPLKHDDGMTVEKCAGMCKGYKFFGLEFSNECFCSNEYSGASRPISDCYHRCKGDTSQFCGAADRVSVYKLIELASGVAPLLELQSVVSTLTQAPASNVKTDPSVKAADTKTPATSVPDLKTPDTKIPVIAVPDLKTPDTKVPVIAIPDIKAPATSVPDLKVPDSKVAEIISDVKNAASSIPTVKIPEVAIPNINPDSKIPVASSPDIKTPASTAPDVKIPVISIPDVKVPAVPDTKAPVTTVPTVKIPEIAIPDVKIPVTTAPDTKAPASTVPTVKIPVVSAPDTKATGSTVPTIKIPEISIPDTHPVVTIPDIKIPDVKIPIISVPDTKTPVSTVPDVKVPVVSVPDTKAPVTTVPTVKVPEVTIPDIKIPDVKIPVISVPDIKTTLPIVPPTVPDVKIPAVGNPDVKAPVVSVPDIKAPATTVSDVKADPSTSSTGAWTFPSNDAWCQSLGSCSESPIFTTLATNKEDCAMKVKWFNADSTAAKQALSMRFGPGNTCVGQKSLLSSCGFTTASADLSRNLYCFPPAPAPPAAPKLATSSLYDYYCMSFGACTEVPIFNTLAADLDECVWLIKRQNALTPLGSFRFGPLNQCVGHKSTLASCGFNMKTSNVVRNTACYV